MQSIVKVEGCTKSLSPSKQSKPSQVGNAVCDMGTFLVSLTCCFCLVPDWF